MTNITGQESLMLIYILSQFMFVPSYFFDFSSIRHERVIFRVDKHLLNCTKIRFLHIEIKCIGYHSHFELFEFDLDMYRVSDNEHMFLDHTKKLYKCASESWRNPPKHQSVPEVLTLYFRVKFYVEKISLLK